MQAMQVVPFLPSRQRFPCGRAEVLLDDRPILSERMPVQACASEPPRAGAQMPFTFIKYGHRTHDARPAGEEP
jgi:hypothetical protein